MPRNPWSPLLVVVVALASTNPSKVAQWPPTARDVTEPLVGPQPPERIRAVAPLQPMRTYRFGDAPLLQFNKSIETITLRVAPPVDPSESSHP
jgi:hypothetical protein